MGWGLAGTGNSSAFVGAAAAVVLVVVAPGGRGSKWESQNRVGFLENRMKNNGTAVKSAKNEKIGI